MVTTEVIQSGLIARMKSLTAVTALVTNSQGVIEIREAEWQGTDFEYPNIRLFLQDTNYSDESCNYAKVNFHWQIFSEERSSKEGKQIISAILPIFPKSFSYVYTNTYLYSGIRLVTMETAIQIRDGIWQQNIRYRGIVSG